MDEEKDLVMRAVTCDAGVIKRLRSLIDGSEALLTEIELVLSNDGIMLRLLDNHKACMIHWNVPSSALAEYQHDGIDKETVVTINAEDLKRAVSTAKKRLEFQLDTDDSNGRFTVIGHSDFRHQEALQLLIPKDDRTKKPSLPFTVGMAIKGETFKSILKSAMKVTRHLTLTAEEKNKIMFEGEGATGEFNAELYADPDDCAYKTTFWNDLAVTRYDAEYLHLFRKFILKGDNVFLQFATKKPIQLLMVDSCGIEVQLTLAPRVERRRINLERAKL